MAAKYGFTKNLSPRQQREMFAADRKRRLGVASRRGKSFIKDNGPLIAVGTLAVLLLVFKKELKSAVGQETLRLTP